MMGRGIGISHFSNPAGQMQAVSNFEQAVSINTSPKELGFLQRVEQLRCGIEDLAQKLEAFALKLDKMPQGITVGEKPAYAPGLGGDLSGAEDWLRSCYGTIERINDRF